MLLLTRRPQTDVMSLTDTYSLAWQRVPSSYSTLTLTDGITSINNAIEHPQATKFNQKISLSLRFAFFRHPRSI
jgi:hypothetical protein